MDTSISQLNPLHGQARAAPQVRGCTLHLVRDMSDDRLAIDTSLQWCFRTGFDHSVALASSAHLEPTHCLREICSFDQRVPRDTAQIDSRGHKLLGTSLGPKNWSHKTAIQPETVHLDFADRHRHDSRRTTMFHVKQTAFILVDSD